MIYHFETEFAYNESVWIIKQSKKNNVYKYKVVEGFIESIECIIDSSGQYCFYQAAEKSGKNSIKYHIPDYDFFKNKEDAEKKCIERQETNSKIFTL